MAEPYRKTSTGSFTCPSSGVIEVIVLDAASQNSKMTLYEGIDVSGREIFNLATIAWDSKIAPNLSIPYSGGLYVSISGTGAGVSVTVR